MDNTSFIILIVVLYIRYNRSEGFITCAEADTQVTNARSALAEAEHAVTTAQTQLDAELYRQGSCITPMKIIPPPSPPASAPPPPPTASPPPSTASPPPSTASPPPSTASPPPSTASPPPPPPSPPPTASAPPPSTASPPPPPPSAPPPPTESPTPLGSNQVNINDYLNQNPQLSGPSITSSESPIPLGSNQVNNNILSASCMSAAGSFLQSFDAGMINLSAHRTAVYNSCPHDYWKSLMNSHPSNDGLVAL